MGENSKGEPQERSLTEACGRIDRIVDRYVQENNHSLQGWADVDPKPYLRDPDRLKQILYRYAAKRVAKGQDGAAGGIEFWISELAAQETVFQDDFDILGSCDIDVNCAMYALRELGIDTKLKPESLGSEVRAVINQYFEKVAEQPSGEQLPFEKGELVVIEDGGQDGFHVAVVEQGGKQFSFRSKLGQLFVVRNSNINDLARLYGGKSLSLYRRKAGYVS